MPAPQGPDPVRRRLLKAGALMAVAACAPRLAREDTPQTPTSVHATTAPSAMTTVPTTTTSEPTTTTTVAPPVVIEAISRDGWGARTPGAFESHVPVRLTCHHTASSGIDPAGAAGRMRGYQRYHMEQGWPDVAYHVVIDQAGRIYQGRPPDARGDTFTEYDPSGHFLACLDGDFDVHQPSDASVESLVGVLTWASQAYGIDPATLGGHRDYASTSCPGFNLYRLRDEIARRVATLLDSGRRIDLSLNTTPP